MHPTFSNFITGRWYIDFFNEEEYSSKPNRILGKMKILKKENQALRALVWKYLGWRWEKLPASSFL